jgi:hypothetical protein
MNVTGFISQQPEPKKGVMTILRSWILDLGRSTEEKISNKIPYFSPPGGQGTQNGEVNYF